MNKSPEAFRTISEVAEQLDVPAHVLRFWESRFTQVKPVKRGGGRRYYRPDDVRLLRGIRGLLYDDGMTIKGVQKILREQGVRHVIELGGDATPVCARGPEAGVPPRAGKADRSLPAAPLFAVAGLADEDGGAPAGAPLPAPEAPRAPAAPEPAAAGGPGGALVRDKASLRRLVAELEALRAVMVRNGT
jgi:DNA-binding transcriptional MerR regulator